VTKRRRRPPLDAATLPALAEFARAYLHEDVVAEHGSAAGAAAAFRRDASPDEQRQLAGDLARLLDAARTWSADRLVRFFSDDLRAAWTPGSLSDVRALAASARDDDRAP
jgi:hypothetical protein